MHADPFAGNSKLLVSSSCDALIRFLLPSLRLEFCLLTSARPTLFFLVSSSARCSIQDGINFCYLIFIAESLAASLSGVKFILVLVHGRKLARFGKGASKNDYSEINNNDITARRDRYVPKRFSPADLDSPGL